LGLDRVGYKKEGYKKREKRTIWEDGFGGGYLECRLITTPEKRGLHGQIDQKIDEPGGQYMDRQIDRMIAFDLKSAKMVIQGEGEVTDETAWVISIARAREECPEIFNDRIVYD